MNDVYLELWKARVGHTGKLTKPIMDYTDNSETFVLADIRHNIEINQVALRRVRLLQMLITCITYEIP